MQDWDFIISEQEWSRHGDAESILRQVKRKSVSSIDYWYVDMHMSKLTFRLLKILFASECKSGTLTHASIGRAIPLVTLNRSSVTSLALQVILLLATGRA